MSLKRLPNDVQSLLCASSHVNSYKRAIEELVHNSLDAESTSIAIRIHIQESTIQVIDNGHGVTKHDFNALGQRYMTSKLIDISTLKAAPKNYGFRGEFIANIITVSQMVKITSRHESTEETWAKTFQNGKEKKFAKMTTRPTNGTTVDIKGFLYNLNIQKRSIDPINELQNIKLFLEQLSLVHNNISLSLRDDSKNEVIFKIHKKRDIYQTLSNLFDIDQTDVLELQVEKNEYKVKGLIGKTDKDIILHWIYLNGKFIHSSNLHKIINEYFKNVLHIKDQRKLKSKKNNDEYELLNQNIPFYFIFVTCPFIDYDISLTPKQTVIEFKNWGQINKLLEKLVKFYIGDVNLKELKKPESKLINQKHTNINYNQDTRDQVKKIMDKILGNNAKKLEVSQLQNGVKGKLVKRKIKKKTVKKSANISTSFRHKETKNTLNNNVSLTSKFEPITEENTKRQNQNLANHLNKNKGLNKIRISKTLDKKLKASDAKKFKLKEMPLQKKEINAKNVSPTRKSYKTSIKQKHKKTKCNNNEVQVFQHLKETDLVYKRSKIVAEKAKEFLQYHTKKRKGNKTQTENANRKSKDNIFLRKKYDNEIVDNMPLPPKINKYMIDKYVMNKLKTKSYKTTYDLVQTILISQQEVINAKKNNMVDDCYMEFPDFDYRRYDNISHCTPRTPKRSIRKNKYIFSEYSDMGSKQEMTQYTTISPIKYKTFDCEDNFTEYTGVHGQKEISDFMRSIPEESGFVCKNICSLNENINYRANENSNRTLSGPLRLLTYDSHRCYNNGVIERNDNPNGYTINRKQNVRFITKQSRDNFATSNGFGKKSKRPSKSLFNKQSKMYDIRMKQTINESLYTIEYSKSNENNYIETHNDMLVNSVDFVNEKDTILNNKTGVNYDKEKLVNDYNPIFGNTYTIQPSDFTLGLNITTQHLTKRQNIKSNEVFATYSTHYSNSELNNDITSKTISKDEHILRDRKNFNIVFVSKSQCSETETPLGNIEPLNVCETVLNTSDTVEKEFAFSFNEQNRLNDSLYDNFENMDGTVVHSIEKDPHQILIHENNDDITENVSHHFSSAVKTQPIVFDYISEDNLHDLMPVRGNQNKSRNEIIRTEDLSHPKEGNVNFDNIDCNIEITNFNFKNRPRFLPKGMSQIFENCRSKTACDYNLDEDYYEDSIYNHFANDVQVNSEIYEPLIQNVEDLTTKNIHKFQNKVKKDSASLVFDEKSLKEAKVLGQADCKFIAAIMKKRCCETEGETEYLILFDQHAVHERIRLEKNLADYINEDTWTSIPLDNITLKMSKDDILYLHNYKDKFTQLGLQWTILNDNEIAVNSIPEAIIGKNPREVEKVIKAVRNLIAEEISVIKLQKGCVSLYPKSIMDLVFSEACRYAIKFGDQLSKIDCVELLNALSNCKTPFQCAHGRPVMAVLMDIKCVKHEYKINMAKLNRFKPSNTANL